MTSFLALILRKRTDESASVDLMNGEYLAVLVRDGDVEKFIIDRKLRERLFRSPWRLGKREGASKRGAKEHIRQGLANLSYFKLYTSC